MKLSTLLLTLVVPTLISFTACNKDKDEIAGNDDDDIPFVMPQGEAAKILGKWQVNSITIKKTFGSTNDTQTFQGTATDYVDFRTDGKMHTFFQGLLDVSNYQVKSAKEITIDTDPATVVVLTDTDLVFRSSDKTGTFGNTEITYDLTR